MKISYQQIMIANLGASFAFMMALEYLVTGEKLAWTISGFGFGAFMAVVAYAIKDHGDRK
jgi:hypothetical protein